MIPVISDFRPNFPYVKKKFDDEESWQTFRRSGIGGSDCAAILGVSPWMTNVELYRQKVDGVEPRRHNWELLDFGKRKEAELIEEFAEAYADQYSVEHRDYDVRQSTRYPFMFASLDGELTDKKTGRKGVLEIKTAQIYWHNAGCWDDDRFPFNYFCQVLHYLSVTAFEFAVLYAKLFFSDGRQETKMYYMDRAKLVDNIKFLESEEKKFWTKHVIPRKIPDLIVRKKINRGYYDR